MNLISDRYISYFLKVIVLLSAAADAEFNRRKKIIELSFRCGERAYLFATFLISMLVFFRYKL